MIDASPDDVARMDATVDASQDAGTAVASDAHSERDAPDAASLEADGGALNDSGMQADADAMRCSAEVCDGIDNDCDGIVDEDIVAVGEPGELVCMGSLPPGVDSSMLEARIDIPMEPGVPTTWRAPVISVGTAVLVPLPVFFRPDASVFSGRVSIALVRGVVELRRSEAVVSTLTIDRTGVAGAVFESSLVELRSKLRTFRASNVPAASAVEAISSMITLIGRVRAEPGGVQVATWRSEPAVPASPVMFTDQALRILDAVQRNSTRSIPRIAFGFLSAGDRVVLSMGFVMSACFVASASALAPAWAAAGVASIALVMVEPLLTSAVAAVAETDECAATAGCRPTMSPSVFDGLKQVARNGLARLRTYRHAVVSRAGLIAEAAQLFMKPREAFLLDGLGPPCDPACSGGEQCLKVIDWRCRPVSSSAPDYCLLETMCERGPCGTRVLAVDSSDNEYSSCPY